ncbi:helix-turn-helix domain-containing protein [Clostridium sp. CF012]|uniref:helix-turn-helix domain-containing protein n=1 Tax=Clostridium sp. CF012 TaxID=2843319 RepID=UPI001C0DD8BD|nr:helix-turn-helix transcriptional regulator [Clostridium sp. CF012]MBU3145530.1 helix-turn-helix transcriptional regulator [Clostridium sp. CF012]
MDNYKLKIKAYRNCRKLTQKQLAENIGISRSFLSEIENDKWDIKISLLIKISKTLKVAPCKLIKYK